MTDLRPFHGLLHRQIPFHPWIYFLIFLISNTLLSYFDLSLQTKLWVGFGGLAVPYLLGLFDVLKQRRLAPASGKFSWEVPSQVFNQAPSTWLWGLFFFCLILTRFYKLTTIPFWLLSDEGIFSTLAMDLSRHWRWEFLWTQGRVEPFLIWLLAFFFKIFPPSLFSLRLFPTLASLASCSLAYWACRQFFSKSFSFMFLWFFSFSFWCFSLMRFCHPNDLIPIFEFLAFGLLGLFFKTKKVSLQWIWILALSTCCGLGFYSYVNWGIVWFFIGLVLLAHGWKENNKDLEFFLAYSALTSLLALPLISARLGPGNLAVIAGKFGPPSLFFSYLDYLNCFFWNGKVSFPFSSNWGGMLNPLTDSLVFIGSLFAIGKIERKFLFWLGLALVLFLLPGTITNHLELYRTTPSLLLWMLLATFGAHCLSIHNFKIQWKPWPVIFTLFIFLTNLTLNGYNFVGHYSNIRGVPADQQWRSVEYWDAYQTLKTQSDQNGPFYIFTEFSTDYDNKTLNIASYPFDVLQNTALTDTSPKWAALILNRHFAPFLIKDFPGLRFKILKTDKSEPDAAPPMGLFLIPLSEFSESLLQRWIQADKIYRGINLRLKNKTIKENWSGFMESFPGLKSQFQEDPLLTAIYWEKLGLFKVLDGHFVQASEAYRNAIQYGLPAAQFYSNLSFCEKLMGQKEKAQEDYKMAISLSIGNP